MLKKMVVTAVMMGTMLLGMVAVAGPIQVVSAHAATATIRISNSIPNTLCTNPSWSPVNSDTKYATDNEGTYSFRVILHSELDELFGDNGPCHRMESITTTTFDSCVLNGARYCFFSGNEDAYLVFSNGTKSTPSSISGAGTFAPGGSNTLGSVTNGPFVTTCGAAGGDYSGQKTNLHAGSAQQCY